MDVAISGGGQRRGVLEGEIRGMDGILAANLEVDESGGIRKVNIVAREGTRSRGQIVQDTVSLVFVRSGIRIPASAVDVIECSDRGLLGGPGRPRLSAIDTERSGNSAVVCITLSLGDSIARGRITTGSGGAGRGVLVPGVEATLRAAEELISHRLKFRIVDVRSFDIAGDEIVLVGVSPVPAIGDGFLIGTARVAGDSIEAASRATLDAINRTFTF